MNPIRTTPLSLLALLPLLPLNACHKQPKPDPKAATLEALKPGMVAYLKARGDLCLGKQFPIDVSEREVQTGSRNALQMPALEHAGIVSSTEAMAETKTEDGSVPTKVRRYRLTDAGQRFYLSREVPGQTTSSGQKVTQSDLCAAKLSLDKVVSFEPSSNASAIVTYTYRVQAAPWANLPEVQQVFPAVTHVLLGAGAAQLKEAFLLTERGWVANELVPASAEPVANR